MFNKHTSLHEEGFPLQKDLLLLPLHVLYRSPLDGSAQGAMILP